LAKDPREETATELMLAVEVVPPLQGVTPHRLCREPEETASPPRSVELLCTTAAAVVVVQATQQHEPVVDSAAEELAGTLALMRQREPPTPVAVAAADKLLQRVHSVALVL
jgi:hypothetical protein